MVQNIITLYGAVQLPDDSYAMVVIDDDTELAELPLDVAYSMPFNVSNQINTWNWEIALSEEDTDCDGIFSIESALYLKSDNSSYELIDSVTVTSGGFVDPVAPTTGDLKYLGMVGPGNLPFFRVKWTGSAVTATAKIKVIVSMS